MIMNLVSRECPEDYFTCGNGKCVAGYLKCDLEDHCGDNSDEVEGCIGKLNKIIS